MTGIILRRIYWRVAIRVNRGWQSQQWYIIYFLIMFFTIISIRRIIQGYIDIFTGSALVLAGYLPFFYRAILTDNNMVKTGHISAGFEAIDKHRLELLTGLSLISKD
jgi:hypothetical protein